MSAYTTRTRRMTVGLGGLALAVAPVLAGCGPKAGDQAPSTDAAPQNDGWISLFNGRDLTGWTPKIAGYDLGVNFGDTFRVEDGVIKVSYDAYDEFDGRFGHLFFERPFSHYVLRLEYRFTGEQAPGGPGWAFRNSGVMFHGQPPGTMRRDQSFPVSIEAQMLGGNGERERSTGNLCTPGTHVVMGDSLVKRHCTNSSSSTYHGDQWVTMELEVRGDELVRHSIGGVVVLEYSQPQLDPNDGDAQAWIDRRAGDVILTGGSISLQAESHACEFRNIELRELR